MAAQKEETLTGESQSTNAAGREQKSDSSQKVGKKAQNNSRHRDQTGKELREDSKSHTAKVLFTYGYNLLPIFCFSTWASFLTFRPPHRLLGSNVQPAS
jgi:hypothetical protein